LDEQLAQQVEDCLNAMWRKKPRVTYDTLVLTLLKDMETKLTKIEGRLDRIEKERGDIHGKTLSGAVEREHR